ncbi:DUF1540 domain-containing protein [Oerskovia turbata]|jgi:hypothetical protein
MSSLMELPQVVECSIDGCGYNHEHGCHAGAVTIAAHGADAECATFIPLTAKGGLEKVIAHVGACQRGECSHNESLECNASSIRVGAGPQGADHADCLTYSPR